MDIATHSITALSTRLATEHADAAAAGRIEQQRRDLQGRIDVLRQAGALPVAGDEGYLPSTVAWSNWSNG